MSDIITVVLSSSVISAIVSQLMSPLLELINSRIEKGKINDERKYNEEEELKKKKEEVYIDAIQIIQLIKNGFYDRTMQQIKNMSASKEKRNELNINIKKINDMLCVVAPKMRLYSTDEIYEIFSDLCKYAIFSYSEKVITQPLLYMYNRKFSYMCKIMQKHLGLRLDYPELPKACFCVGCGTMHNSKEDCPKCGIKWNKAVEIINEIEKDEEMKSLIFDYIQNGQDPYTLVSYPINCDKWKEALKKNLNAK